MTTRFSGFESSPPIFPRTQLFFFLTIKSNKKNKKICEYISTSIFITISHQQNKIFIMHAEPTQLIQRTILVNGFSKTKCDKGNVQQKLSNKVTVLSPLKVFYAHFYSPKYIHEQYLNVCARTNTNMYQVTFLMHLKN